MEIITKDNFELKPNTFVLVNKPINWTSFDVVGYLRKMFRQKYPDLKKIKVGHAGTLDPFATGLLIVAIGREATREIENFKNLNKTYEAIFKLGEISNTGDNTGNIQPYTLKQNIFKKLLFIIYCLFKKPDHWIPAFAGMTKELPYSIQIEKILKRFLGKQSQIPPMFSAKKINGQRLYKLARQGKKVKRKANQIEIFSLTLLEYNYPFLKVEVVCSPGTYIRTLGEDIGKKLQIGAFCSELKRTKIGEYSLTNAINLNHEIASKNRY
ncbi:MAG: tRNA pseudouridine(55) synthase TruB [Candidatus Magasanikbacteria bacterium]|nr:tRNA pseudouridine(55) synthase TruB [Candidatus Magasanikbacteria bacterium]